MRINDKIEELEMQVGPLKKQAEVAKQYLLLRDELRVQEISLWMASLDKLYPWVKGRFRRSILCLKGGDVLSEISELGRRCGVPPGRVRVWSIEEWLNDDYFKEKFVIEVGKDYLCPPKSEN